MQLISQCICVITSSRTDSWGYPQASSKTPNEWIHKVLVRQEYSYLIFTDGFKEH